VPAQYGHSWMRTTVQARKAQDWAATNPHEELKQYLDSPLEVVDDVVSWWGVSCTLYILQWRRTNRPYQHHSMQYPTLSHMAQDYLAIQGSAVASERAFSSGALTATARAARHNRLSVIYLRPSRFSKVDIAMAISVHLSRLNPIIRKKYFWP